MNKTFKRGIDIMTKRMCGVLVLIFMLMLPVVVNAYEVVNVKNGATLKGKVVFKGTPPDDEVIVIDRNPNFCGQEKPTNKYLIKDGRVKNVVIWLEGISKGKPIPERDVSIIIKDCTISPLVSIGFVGKKYRIKNMDPILHTIQLKLGLSYHKDVSTRKLTYGATIYNFALPEQGMEVIKPIKRFHRYTSKTGFIRVTSNAHPWMRGFIFVFDHPYAAITDEKGEFEIDEIPPGEYVLKYWHEGNGIKEQKIRISPGEVKSIELQLGSDNIKKSETGKPSAFFKNTRYDFGSIKLGEKISHDFELINKGDNVLRIVDLIPA